MNMALITIQSLESIAAKIITPAEGSQKSKARAVQKKFLILCCSFTWSISEDSLEYATFWAIVFSGLRQQVTRYPVFQDLHIYSQETTLCIK